MITTALETAVRGSASGGVMPPTKTNAAHGSGHFLAGGVSVDTFTESSPHAASRVAPVGCSVELRAVLGVSKGDRDAPMRT